MGGSVRLVSRLLRGRNNLLRDRADHSDIQ